MSRSVGVFAAVAVVLAAFTCAPGAALDESVAVLTMANVSAAATGDWVLVLYAPWCPHCHALLEVLPAVARTLQAAEPPVRVAVVDADAEPAVQMQFSLSGFPTVFRVHDGAAHELPARVARTETALAQWATAEWAQEPAVAGVKAPFGVVMRAFGLYSAFAIGAYRFLEVYAHRLSVPPMWFFCGVAGAFAVLVIAVLVVVSRLRPARAARAHRKHAAPAPEVRREAAIAERERAEHPLEGAAVAGTERVREKVRKEREEQKLRKRAAKEDKAGIRSQSNKPAHAQKPAKQQNRPTQQPVKRS